MTRILIKLLLHNYYNKELQKSVVIKIKTKVMPVTPGMGEVSRILSNIFMA
jgi:hypothetical protein